jgi:hypothetical protein
LYVLWNPHRKAYLTESTIEIAPNKTEGLWTHDKRRAQTFSRKEKAEAAAKILAKIVGFDVSIMIYE